MTYLDNSLALTGYNVKIIQRPAFRVVGYTLIVPPNGEEAVPAFWDAALADGRIARLTGAPAQRPWLLGLGSWDPECEKKGFRYTLCVEQTPDPALQSLVRDERLHRVAIGASEWMCFELTQVVYDARFWRDDPYKMMKTLGYRFFAGEPGTGLHFDAYPPDYDAPSRPAMEFWITVTRRRERS